MVISNIIQKIKFMSDTQTKKLTTPDGTIVYYLHGKMHNLEGPAHIPEGDNRRREYYINGIKFTEADWKAAKRDGDGLQYFKQSGNNIRF
jgi:antitoxin component YwqK of YwqJK toxin-antitoxin module